jgi:hypothetical protein
MQGSPDLPDPAWWHALGERRDRGDTQIDPLTALVSQRFL